MASYQSPTPAGAARPPVLLLEDEPVLGMMLADLIEEAGCEPIDVRTPDEAIAILETRTDIRVVVADLDTRGSIAGLRACLTMNICIGAAGKPA